MRVICFWIIFCSVIRLIGQPAEGLIAYYSFEDGTITDQSANAGSNGIIIGSPIPACGALGNALEFDGSMDNALLGGQIERFFEGNDFTLSFYFRVTENLGTHDILSKREMCNAGAGLSISYNAPNKRLNAAFIEDADKQILFSERLDPNSCLYHVVFVKNRNGISLYVNGELQNRLFADDLDLRNSAMLYIANSPCLGVTDRRMAGIIDEFRLYNRELNLDELNTLYTEADKILTADTTILSGGSVNVRVNAPCTGSFRWSPDINVLDINDPFTTLTPSQTTTYNLEMIYPNCTATDTLRVTVIDPSDVECGFVPMPNTFTPNGDGINDRFFISNPFTLEELNSFEVFDRWGNQVFITTDKNGTWDGTFQGEPLGPGPFLYRIRYNCQGEEQEKSGNVLLIR